MPSSSVRKRKKTGPSVKARVGAHRERLRARLTPKFAGTATLAIVSDRVHEIRDVTVAEGGTSGDLLIDAAHRLVGLFDRVDERKPHLTQLDRLELGEERVAEGLGGDTGAI